jgi:DNA polymerase I-like protein with 3'-5' exonuclease and polymerase domains
VKVSLKQVPFLSGVLKEWAYNALDCTGTLEVFETLEPRLNEVTRRTYEYELALCSPALAMMCEGVLVDEPLRSKRVQKLTRELTQIVEKINELPIVKAKWDATELETGLCDANEGKRHKWPRGVADSVDRRCERCGKSRLKPSPFNPGSSHQKNRLFYKVLGIPPYRGKNGEITVDDEALDKIGHKFPEYRDITTTIVEYQKTKKQIGFLNGKRTAAGRYPSSFNVGTAWTGRFSSSKNPFGLGGNLQNVAERNRDIFVSDPGWVLFYADLEQAESNIVAHLAGDDEYIAAHKSGDVHTYVTRLIWPELPWTGDLAQDKSIAKGLPEWDNVPGHDFRFQAKRIQHGSNYGLTPPGISIIAHIPQSAAKFMQRRYFDNFPEIPAWHKSVIGTIENHQPLLTPLGRRFKFFGRPDDKHTHKQGLAAGPQSMVADILDLAMWRIWYELHGRVRLLAQVHDALLGMYRVGDTDALRRVIQLMSIPVIVGERVVTIGVEAAIGRNWGKRSPSNPDGLVTWKE